MKTKIVYQIDHIGFLIGETVADESPLEPGVWVIPRGAVEAAPPAVWPPGKTPRWNGATWRWSSTPVATEVEIDPVLKLRRFLQANPDVGKLLVAADSN